MADIGEEFELAELLAIFAVFGIGAYLVYNFFKTATCISKVGAIPGVTGATQGQVSAAANAASVLKPGGQTIWQSGSDFDYLQPCKAIVTEARHNWVDYLPGINALVGAQPVTYTCVPVSCYKGTIPAITGGTSFTAGTPLCCCKGAGCG